MPTWEWLVLVLVGCSAGFLNVMAGGGSLISMPVLVLMGMDGPVANGTNRVAILVQNISATGGFFRQGFSDFKLSLSLALCALPGAALGAYLGTRVGGALFNRILAGVMVAVMVLMARRKRDTQQIEGSAALRPKRVVAAHILMVGAGIYGGFIQAGVGFILMAILHRVLGLDLIRVNMHKVFIVGTYTLAALFIFASKGEVDWIAGAILAVGNAAGGWVATILAIKKGEKLIRIILYILLAVMAMKLVLSNA